MDAQNAKFIAITLFASKANAKTIWCYLCSMNTAARNPTWLLLHCATVHELGVYVCPTCKYATKKVDELSNHVDQNHESVEASTKGRFLPSYRPRDMAKMLVECFGCVGDETMLHTESSAQNPQDQTPESGIAHEETETTDQYKSPSPIPPTGHQNPIVGCAEAPITLDQGTMEAVESIPVCSVSSANPTHRDPFSNAEMWQKMECHIADQRLKCNICASIIIVQWSNAFHKRRLIHHACIHADMPVSPCLLCGAKMDYWKSRLDHMRRFHRDVLAIEYRFDLNANVEQYRKAIVESIRQCFVPTGIDQDTEVVLSSPALLDVDHLFDGSCEAEKVIYMGIDRADEINAFFQKHCMQSDNDFVRAFVQYFYGDDMYFWMFRSDCSIRTDLAYHQPPYRRSLGNRDPNGVLVVKKILTKYWTMAVWTRNSDNIRKTIESEHFSETELQQELAHTKRVEMEKWLLTANKLMNGWGNDSIERSTLSPWTKSLYGRSVSDPRAEKPTTYDSVDENEWRNAMLDKRTPENRGTRTRDSYLPAWE